MKRLIDFLSPLGVLLALGALAWQWSGRPLAGGLRPWLIGAAGLVLCPPRPALGRGGGRPLRTLGEIRGQHRGAGGPGPGHPGRPELDGHPLLQALRPDQGPALQPLRPDPEGREGPEGRGQDHLLRPRAGPRPRAGTPEGVPGHRRQAEGRVRGPGEEAGGGRGLRRARPLAHPGPGEGQGRASA